jgi:capsular polysaccharide transport system ATP-binding protein
MSVRLENVTKCVRVQGVEKALFSGLNLNIEPGARIGILAPPKSGKTTLTKLIAGTERLDGGKIRKDMSVSWPIPMSDFAVAHSSIAWNVRSVARIYGVRNRDFIDQVAKFGGLTEMINTPMEKCPPYVRGQLGFAVGIAMDFDLYLFDNLIVPPRKEFKEEALGYLRERTEGKAILLVTGVAQSVADCCDMSYVLEGGQLTPFPDVKQGVEYFKAMLKAAKDLQNAQQEQQGVTDDDKDAMSEEYDRSVEFVQAGIGDLM